MSTSSTFSTHNESFDSMTDIDIDNVKIGDIVQFSYNNELKYVFVVDPDRDGKLHGLTLEEINKTILVTEVMNNMAADITARDLYETIVCRNAVKELKCYRMYHKKNISQLQIIDYDKD